MLNVVKTKKFRRDVKIAKKRNYDISLLKKTIIILAKQEELPKEYKDHALKGSFEGFRECHIAPDWILVYTVVENKLELILLRTGTHSDVF